MVIIIIMVIILYSYSFKILATRYIQKIAAASAAAVVVVAGYSCFNVLCRFVYLSYLICT
jgi:hypothetical protein